MPKTEISVWERLEDGEFLDLEQKKEVCNGLSFPATLPPT